MRVEQREVAMNDAGRIWILLVGRILFALNFTVVAGYGFQVAKTHVAVRDPDRWAFPFQPSPSGRRVCG
jgi:hypothetical protein